MKTRLATLFAALALASTAAAQDAAPAKRGPFGVALTAGLGQYGLGVTVDYDLTSQLNARFTVSPYPEALALDLAYAFRTETSWRTYVIGGVAYRFLPGYDPRSRLAASAGVGIEYQFFPFWQNSAALPIWSRFEFGLATPNDLSYPTTGLGLFTRIATVIRF